MINQNYQENIKQERLKFLNIGDFSGGSGAGDGNYSFNNGALLVTDQPSENVF
jgi:hypothetical protein